MVVSEDRCQRNLFHVIEVLTITVVNTPVNDVDVQNEPNKQTVHFPEAKALLILRPLVKLVLSCFKIY